MNKTKRVKKLAKAAGGEQSTERLLNATHQAWESHGRARMSVRQISQMAGTPASLVNYYYGTFDRLLSASQDEILKQAQAWCNIRLSWLPARSEPFGAEAFGHFLAAIIDDWCANRRGWAFACCECRLMAARDPKFVPLALRWRDLWKGFWERANAALGYPSLADLTRQFFIGESFMHRILWRPPLDGACLSELCLGWARLMIEGRAGHGPLRSFVCAQAGKATLEDVAEGAVPTRIAEAAVVLIGREGLAAVTHRAVAREAKVNLGAVTYHFPSIASLLKAAWMQIYLQVTVALPARNGIDENRTMPPMKRIMIGFARFTKGEQSTAMMALQEFLCAASRDPSLAELGAMIRHGRGRAILNLLQQDTDSRPFGILDAALISVWLHGLHCDLRFLPAAEAEAGTKACVRQICAIMQIEAGDGQ